MTTWFFSPCWCSRNVNQSLKYWMFISHFFDVGNWVESSEFPLCPPKEAISPAHMEPCGRLQVVCGSLCQEGPWEERVAHCPCLLSLIQARLCAWVLDLPFLRRTQIIWHLVPSVPPACPLYSPGLVHSLPGMSLAFLSSSFSLPNLSYCLNFTPIGWPMPVSSCTWNHPIQPHSNLNTEKRIFIAPNWVRKEAKGSTITCALVTFQSVFYSTLV